MTLWLCVETRRVHQETRWFRFKLAFWQTLVNHYAWPHRICNHYVPLNPRQEQS